MRYIFDGNTVLEQRYEPRYKARLAIYYGPSHQNIMRDYSINVSTGGIFVETDEPLPEDTNLFIKFMLPVMDDPITCKSKVAWTNEPGRIKSQELPAGMGLQFLDLPLDSIHSIREYIYDGGLEPEW
jgi:uncharacterized protein (TIGR02266 family)